MVSSFQETIGEDTLTQVGDDSLRLDTARYQLADDVRAFAVRFNSVAHGANCADIYSGDKFRLFVRDGAQLRPVLRMNMSSERWFKG